MPKQTSCCVAGCSGGGQITRGMCNRHYCRWKSRKHLLEVLPPRVNPCWEFFRAAVLVETDDCVVWPFAAVRGYGVVSRPGRGGYVRVHRLACELAHGLAPSRAHQVLHGPCHDPACFNGRHLSWGTPAQNAADKVRDGTALRGEQMSQAKLTEADVREVRSLRAAGVPCRLVAARFGIGERYVREIVRRRCWGHVA